MLAFTISKTLDQQVTFERDSAVADRYGARAARDWQPHVTVACKAWWERQSSRGPARLEETPSEEVAVGLGGLLIPGGTDVTADDRIGEIRDKAGNVIFDGPLHIIAVLPHASYPALLELAFKEPA
jgi:hypothetical protein